MERATCVAIGDIYVMQAMWHDNEDDDDDDDDDAHDYVLK